MRARYLLLALAVVTILLAAGSVFVRPEFRVALRASGPKVFVTVDCISPWKQWTGGGSRFFGGVDSFHAPDNGYLPLDPSRCPEGIARHEHYSEGLAIAGVLVVVATLVVSRRRSRPARVVAE